MSSLEREIEATRDRLADTIDQLVYRTHPKTIVSREVRSIKGYFVDLGTGQPRTDNILKVAAGVAGVITVLAVVRRIVEAGRLTGSGMNGQPWHFIVVRDRETLRKLGALASSGAYVAQAPLAVVVATDKSRFAVSDASRAIQSMMLAAWEDGVGSNWVGFGGLERVKTVLGRALIGS